MPAPASDDSSFVPLVDTLKPSASKIIRNFRYIYNHRQKVHTSKPAPADPSPGDGPPLQTSTSPSDLNISITPRKGNRSYTNHHISKFNSYDHLNATFRQFALSVFSEYIPSSCEETLLIYA